MLSNAFLERHLFQRSRLSDLLYPVSLVYSAIQKARGKKGLAQAIRLPYPLIGIGNIVSGGSGKTPFTLALAKAVCADAYRPAVSHRGYKGKLEGTPSLISRGEGPLFPAADCGDEAWLMAKTLSGIPVVVGKDRLRAVDLLSGLEPRPDIVLMDDVFQNHKLIKDIDIVCFDAAVGIGNGRLIPAGYLREGLPALKRAGLVVITRKQVSIDPAPLIEAIRPFCPWVEVLDYSLTGIEDSEGGAIETGSVQKSILVSGIAFPASFERLAATAGITWTRHFAFRDHYHFQSREALKPLLDYIRAERIEHVCCTAKDVAKLSQHKDLKPLLAVLVLGPDQNRVDELWQMIKERL